MAKSVDLFIEAFRYFSNLLGKGKEKLAKEFAEQATGIKAPEKLEPVIPGNEVVRIPSKVERGELTTINSQLSDPMKSDFINSSMDGTAANRYAVLKTELNKMSPNLTQDLQYALDNNLGLTQVQKNNIVKNAELERTLKSEVKKLEDGLIAEKKNPQMIFEAYTSASKTLEGKEMFKGFEPKVIEGGKGKATPVDDGTKGIDDLFDKDGVLDKDAVLSDITETLSEEPTSLYDENFKDYFDPDDKPKQAKGGIISLT